MKVLTAEKIKNTNVCIKLWKEHFHWNLLIEGYRKLYYANWFELKNNKKINFQVIIPFVETSTYFNSLKYILSDITMSRKPWQCVAVWLPGDMYICPKGQKTPGGDKQATDKHRTPESSGPATVKKILLGKRRICLSSINLIFSASFHSFLTVVHSKEIHRHSPHQIETTLRQTLCSTGLIRGRKEKRRWVDGCMQRKGEGAEEEVCPQRQN